MPENKPMTGYPSIDKPWLKYYSEAALAMRAPECTVYRNIYDNNKAYPNDTALLYFGNRISYGKLFADVEVSAKSLKQIGIQPGACVTICSAGVPESIGLVLACSKIGAIANFINPLFSTEQMIDRINDTEAEWLLTLSMPRFPLYPMSFLTRNLTAPSPLSGTLASLRKVAAYT